MPTTSIPVAFSLICYLLGGASGGNRELYLIFSMSFKLHTLSMIAKEQKNRQEITFALRENLEKLKRLHNERISFKE
jgi:hypothetical protein